jgi:hypothetical protein
MAKKGASKKFIGKAIKREGALTAKAKAAGMSIDAFARAHEHDGNLTGMQARFYLNTLKPIAQKKKKQSSD